MLDLSAIASEIEAGLPNERKRLDDAIKNLDFYRGNFDAYRPRPSNGEYEDSRFERLSLIMQRVVVTLAQHLYARGPAREFPDGPELTAWLQGEYEREGVDGQLQEADRLSLAADVAGVQVIGSGDPARPARFRLWAANELVVWVDPADPTRPAAVATIDLFDHQRRLRLWTDEVMFTYVTDKLVPGQTAGGVCYRFAAEEENYYGCIPFAFVHVAPPVGDFWTQGPGDTLRKLNDWINFALTDVGDGIRYCVHPVLKAMGLGSWKPKTPVVPGDIWYMPPGAVDAGGNGPLPDVDWLAPPVDFVEAAWADLQSLVDHTLETLGIPRAAFRMVDASAQSGAAIVAEQIPLILHAQGRQRPFGFFERELARVAIRVAAAELGRLGAAVPAFLDPAAADRMALRWPAMVPEVPLIGADAAAADQADLALGLTSRVQIVMRRFNLSRAQAIAHLKQVAADRAEETSLGLASPAAPAPAAAAIPPEPADAEESPDGQSEPDQQQPRPGDRPRPAG